MYSNTAVLLKLADIERVVDRDYFMDANEVTIVVFLFCLCNSHAAFTFQALEFGIVDGILSKRDDTPETRT